MFGQIIFRVILINKFLAIFLAAACTFLLFFLRMAKNAKGHSSVSLMKRVSGKIAPKAITKQYIYMNVTSNEF